MAFTRASDPDDIALLAYFGAAYPMVVVIDKAGIVRHVEVGAGDPAQLDALVTKLLR